MQSSSSFSVAIAGAGLSGLCLAQALLRAGIDVQVYERDETSRSRPQGYRITIDKHGIGALRRCLPSHLFELVLATASDPGGYFRVTNGELGEVFRFTFNGDPDNGNFDMPRQVDRQTLRTILLSGLEGRVHFGKAAERVRCTSEAATLIFSDGSTAEAPLVVGADGVNSALRRQILPECDPIDTGYVAIYGRTMRFQEGRSLVPDSLEDSGVMALGTPGAAFFFTTMRFREPPPDAFARLAPEQEPPVTEEYVMWAVLLPKREVPTDLREQSAETLHRLAMEKASDFHPLLRTFVSHADIEYTLPVRLSAAKRPSNWPVSRATLLGDAVHVMPPTGAHGGNTALRDAALLAEKIIDSHAQRDRLERAIGAYQNEMVTYAFREVAASQAMLRRLGSRNPVMRWAMLRAIPWLRSRRGQSLAVADH